MAIHLVAILERMMQRFSVLNVDGRSVRTTASIELNNTLIRTLTRYTGTSCRLDSLIIYLQLMIQEPVGKHFSQMIKVMERKLIRPHRSTFSNLNFKLIQTHWRVQSKIKLQLNLVISWLMEVSSGEATGLNRFLKTLVMSIVGHPASGMILIMLILSRSFRLR
jgi:tRNA isopentenyl-2-thiomethyl-A-37 hydroxylase MiaE